MLTREFREGAADGLLGIKRHGAGGNGDTLTECQRLGAGILYFAVQTASQDGVGGAKGTTSHLDFVCGRRRNAVATLSAEPSVANEATAPIVGESVELTTASDCDAGRGAEMVGS
jgi:hypothetical protein